MELVHVDIGGKPSFKLEKELEPEVVCALNYKGVRIVKGEKDQHFLVGLDPSRKLVVLPLLLPTPSSGYAVTVSNLSDIKQITNKSKENSSPHMNNHMRLILEIFTKYGVQDIINSGARRDFVIRCVLNITKSKQQSLKMCETLLEKTIVELETKTHQNAKSHFQFSMDVLGWSAFRPNSDWETLSPHAAPQTTAVKWIESCICLVPIQIARAVNNGLIPMPGGLKAVDLSGLTSQEVASVINFGLYGIILKNCKTPVKVICSMGKQSTGKVEK